MQGYFKRKVYDQMLDWKKEYAPKYALFLKGARRTGKTYLAKKLGEEKYESFITISFDRVSSNIKELFVESLEDLDYLFNTLEVTYKTRLIEGKSLIILDEIQLFPEARQALKTLLEDGRFDYIETGSLASIEKRNKDILIPSEEYQLEVQPLDFEEFLWALGDDITVDIIRKHYETLKPFGSQMLRSIKKSFREYMCVGGMPQAIETYIDTKNFGKTDYVKQGILSLYRSDMAEQQEENSNHAINFFDRIPSELSKQDKRYVISHLEKNARIRDYQGAIKWLNDAKVINIVPKVNDISIAFNLFTNDSSFKCYLLDTGLLISLAYKDRPYLENDLYRYIIEDRLQVNEGMLIGNVVAQCLKANGHVLYFYKKEIKETKKTYEIDFVIRKGNKISLIEAKSSESNSIKSLKMAKDIYGKTISNLYVLHDGEIKIGSKDKNDEGIIYLPYFMACVI